MKRIVLLGMCLLVLLEAAFGTDVSSLLYLKTSVLPLNTLSFYPVADESATYENDTLWMGDGTDNGNSATTYLVAKTNASTQMQLEVTLPAMVWVDDDSNALAQGSTLAYTTKITLYSPTDSDDVTIEPDVSALSNSTSAKKFGTITGAHGAQKGIYQFDFTVSEDDYWAAFQGAYAATVSVTLSTD
jgi:hypothetical protein